MSLPLNGDNLLYALSFAHDQVLLAQDNEDVNYMMRKLIEEFAKRVPGDFE